MPNEKPNATPTDDIGPGDPAYTVQVKVNEIVTCLKHLAVMALNYHELELARNAITAAELVDALEVEPDLGDAQWTGL